MTNEATGDRPTVVDDSSSPFDVAPEAGTKPGTYLIGVEEIEHEVPPEELADAPLASDAAVAEAGAAVAAPVVTKQKIPRDYYFDLPPAGPTREVPDYFPPGMIPKGIKFPQGLEAVFVKIPAEFTSARHKGDRFLILWGLSEADEMLSIGRSMGDSNRGGGQMAKQMIRAVDGHVADWSGMPTPGSVDQIWREIGPKGRNLMTRLLLKLNTLSEEEAVRFFSSCIAVVPTG